MARNPSGLVDRRDCVKTYAEARKPPRRRAPYVAGTLTILHRKSVCKKKNRNTKRIKEGTKYEEIASGRKNELRLNTGEENGF